MDRDESLFRVRTPIFYKMVVPVLLLFLLATFWGTFLVVRLEREALTRQIIRSGEIIAHNVASMTQNAFWSLNWVSVEEFLREMRTDPASNIIYVRIVRPDGMIYLADDRGVYGDAVDSTLLSAEKALRRDFPFEAQGERGILVTHSATIGKDSWHVLVGLSLREVDAFQAAWIKRSMIWGAMILVLVVALILILARAVSRPIIALAKSAENIARGNLDQSTPVTTRDEVGLLGAQFNRMVAHLKAAQSGLAASEQRYRTLIDSASSAQIGIALIQNEGDRRGVVKYVNTAVSRISGYSRDELLGMSVKDFVHPEDLKRVWRLFTRGPSTNVRGEPMSFRGIHKDGRTVPIEFSTALTEHDGKKALAVFIRDITEKVQAAQQLEKHQEELEQTVQERTADLQRSLSDLKHAQSQLLHAEKLASIGQLAAGIAHEINTPAQFVGDNAQFLRASFEDLNTVIDACETILASASRGRVGQELIQRAETALRDADLEFVRREIPLAIEQVQDGIERISRIVRSMKEFAHPGGKEKILTDINKALENTITVARNEWKYAADLETDLDPDLPQVLCLPGEINQVFLNVLINACQAVRDGAGGDPGRRGTIRVSTARVGDHAEIRISDTGRGIPHDVQSKIFDPFFTTKAVGQGSGQGLAIAYAVVVEQHGGTITFATEEGRGTTFIVRLPVEG